MKNNDLDLKQLENADNETIRRMSENYTAVTKSDMKRLFDKTEKMYRDRTSKITTEHITEVSDVDIYHRPLWHKVLAIASALMLVAGIGTSGFLMLKNIENKSSVSYTEISISDEKTEECAPFGDISEGRIRFMTSAYAPYLLDTSPDTVKELADVFNSSVWQEIDINTPLPDGETVTVYVYNNSQHFKLVFYGDNTVDCEISGNTSRYKVPEDVANIVYSAANPQDPVQLSRNLIPCKVEDITTEGVWKNNEPVPETIFEAPAVPKGIENTKLFIDSLILQQDFDFQNIENNAKHSDNLIIGKVNNISFNSKNGTAFTQIDITVSEDVTGTVYEGENISIELAGGYIPIRDLRSDVLEDKFENEIDMKKEDIDNGYCHEIIESGEVPIIGKEYAFFVSDKGEKTYDNVGLEYGILYKCDNLYIQRNNQGFNFYDLDELKAMLNSENSTELS